MKIEHKQINTEVSNEHNIEFEIVKSISDKVFSSWVKWIRKPDTLILKIRGLGKNYYRKKKVQRKLDQIPLSSHPPAQNFIDVLEFIMEQYELYSTEKKSFRNANKDIELNGN